MACEELKMKFEMLSKYLNVPAKRGYMLSSIADCFLYEGKRKEALKLKGAAISEFKRELANSKLGCYDLGLLHVWLGYCYIDKPRFVKHLIKAAEFFAKENVHALRKEDRLRPVMGMYNAATCYLILGKRREARELFLELHSKKRSLNVPSVFLASSLFRMGSVEAALETLKEALDRETSSFIKTTLKFIAGCYSLVRGDTVYAEKMFRGLLANPDIEDEMQVYNLKTYALCHLALGNFGEALDILNFTIETMEGGREIGELHLAWEIRQAIYALKQGNNEMLETILKMMSWKWFSIPYYDTIVVILKRKLKELMPEENLFIFF
ncbi:MAG: tetratricopeptide repeat protein [Candidatus Freyarchaeota archaeon]|nr:hypothetical protein [Candidatus Freyrarchaeum guaymaensis]